METNCDDQLEPIAIHPRGNVRLCSAPPVLLTPLPEIVTDNPDWQCGCRIAERRDRFFHLTASTADQVATFHLWSVLMFYISTCVCLWACVSMCLACDKPQPPSAGELSNHNLWWTWLRLKQCSARCVKPLQRVLQCMFVQFNKFCIERWACTTHL